jgi:hypothetical protein
MLDDSTLNVSLLGGFLVLLVVFFVSRYILNNDRGVRASPSYLRHNLNNHPRLQLNAIPTIGFSIPILTYLSAVRFIFDAVRMLDEGYKKVICLLLFARSSYQADDAPCLQTNPGLFKISSFRRWMVLATGSALIDDIKKAPDDVLSHAQTTDEVCSVRTKRRAHTH